MHLLFFTRLHLARAQGENMAIFSLSLIYCYYSENSIPPSSNTLFSFGLSCLFWSLSSRCNFLSDRMNCKVSRQRSSLSVDASPQKFHKMNCKFRSRGPVLPVDASPQKFRKMNCKISQERSGLASGCFTAKVSQNELKSFAAKVRSCQWKLHRKSFRK